MSKKNSGGFQLGTIAALAIMCVFLAIANHNFYSVSNLMGILKQTAFNAFLATGMLMCLLTAGIGFIWLIPYVETSVAGFYEDVKADYALNGGLD